MTQYFNKSEEVFDDYFNPASIDDFSLEIPENADVRKIVIDYFMWY